MSMSWLENELRKTQDPADAERADIIAAIKNSRGADVPLPENEAAEAVPEDQQAVGLVALRSAPVVLRDANNGIITEDMKKVLIDHEATQAMRLKARQVLEPYDHLFDQYVPSAGKLGSMLGRQPRKARAAWSFGRTYEDMNVAYSYELHASRDRGIERVVLGIRSQHDNDGGIYGKPESPSLGLAFNANQIQTVSLNWRPRVDTIMSLAAGTELSQFIEGFMLQGGNGGSCHVKFDLNTARPTLSIGQHTNRLDSSSYQFDPARANFQRYIGNVDKHNYAVQSGASRPESLSQEEFLRLLGETMNLIPTISQEDIQQA